MQRGWCKELHGNILHISMNPGKEMHAYIKRFLKTIASRTHAHILFFWIDNDRLCKMRGGHMHHTYSY